jgi:hypothetical protein
MCRPSLQPKCASRFFGHVRCGPPGKRIGSSLLDVVPGAKLDRRSLGFELDVGHGIHVRVNIDLATAVTFATPGTGIHAQHTVLVHPQQRVSIDRDLDVVVGISRQGKQASFNL